MEGASFFLYFIKRRNIDGGRRRMKDEIGGWQKIITDFVFFFFFLFSVINIGKSSNFRRTFNLVKMITEPSNRVKDGGGWRAKECGTRNGII